MRASLLAIALMLSAVSLSADTLITPSYRITIKGCDDYVVSCDTVNYVGISRKTGKSITLTGATVHLTGADGVRPSRFLGYTFKNGTTTYFVSEDGEFWVTQGSKVIVRERGVWK